MFFFQIHVITNALYTGKSSELVYQLYIKCCSNAILFAA